MELWIKDLSEISKYSVSVLNRWLKSGFLFGYISDERRQMIKLESEHILKINKELSQIQVKVKERFKEMDKKKSHNSVKYKDLKRFCDLWNLKFDKESFSVNNHEVEFRKKSILKDEVFDGRRYFIGERDILKEFYGDDSSDIKRMLNYVEEDNQ
jgi:hypothetical protein